VVLLLAHAGDTEAQMRSDAFLFIPEQAGLKEYWLSRGPFDAEGPLLARSGRSMVRFSRVKSVLGRIRAQRQISRPLSVGLRSGFSCQHIEKAGESGWDRTIDTLIKSQVLYH
jgi:hypothetical protein